jgi:hypothetical protein
MLPHYGKCCRRDHSGPHGHGGRRRHRPVCPDREGTATRSFRMPRPGFAPAAPAAPSRALPDGGQATCPLCRNHCPVSAPGCAKGKAYAASLGTDNGGL